MGAWGHLGLSYYGIAGYTDNMPKRATRPYQRYRVPKGRHLVVAVDPSKWHCGVAIAEREGERTRLRHAATVRIPKRRRWRARDMAVAVAEWVVDHTFEDERILWVHERMQKYEGDRDKYAALDDLIAVCETLRDYLGKPAAQYPPREWKGSLGKAAHHARLAEILTPNDVPPPERTQHDTWDALGIALYATGRTDAAGTLRR